MSTYSSVRLVLFDLDGTLVDHRGAAAAAVEQVLSNGNQEQQEDKVA